MSKNELWFRNWEFNMTQVLNLVMERVQQNGGFLCRKKGYPSFGETIKVHNRIAEQEVKELTQRIAQIEDADSRFDEATAGDRERELHFKRIDVIAQKREQLKKAQEVRERVIETQITTYIEFYLDGFVYYFQYDDNPFFPKHYMKVPAKENELKVEYDYYLEEFDDGWIYDYLLRMDATQQELQKTADTIYDRLIHKSAKPPVKKRRRVYNGSKYEYEYEVQKARDKEYEKVDWNGYRIS